MLTGKKLGDAIRAAIKKKGVTQKAVAAHFGIKPPSVQDWINKGTIGKDKLPALWEYFGDVAGPEHWGLRTFPVSADKDSFNVAPTRPAMPFAMESQVEVRPELDGSNPIPTDMPFSNRNLSQTFRLLGNIIGALPASKRAVLAEHLTDLAEDPEAANYIAKQAVKRLGVPDAITGNAQLNRWLAGDLEITVETRPAPLGIK